MFVGNRYAELGCTSREDVAALVRFPNILAFVKSHRVSAPMVAATAMLPKPILVFAPTGSPDPDALVTGVFEAAVLPVVALGQVEDWEVKLEVKLLERDDENEFIIEIGITKELILDWLDE
jgi:hypothetical protein